VFLNGFSFTEVIDKGGVGFGDAAFFFVDEGLTEGEEQPVAIGDEDVVEEFAEFGVFSGGLMLLDRPQKVEVGPPLVADELIDECQHGRNVADGLHHEI